MVLGSELRSIDGIIELCTDGLWLRDKLASIEGRSECQLVGLLLGPLLGILDGL
jgi:hypothetical protein